MFTYDVQKELLWKVIGDLTFRPNIRISDLYESMAEQKPHRSRYDKPGKSTLSIDEKSNAYKRMQRLLPLFLADGGDGQSVETQLSMPKIYEDLLFERKIHLHNAMAKQYHGKLIDSVLPISLIREVAYMDGATPTVDEIIKHYPYYFEGKEKGFDFLEYMLLLNVAEVTQYKTQALLKKLLDKPNDREKIKKWTSSLKANISSSQMYLSYADTFFAVYRYDAIIEYNKMCVEVQKYQDAVYEGEPDFTTYHLWRRAENAASYLADLIETVIPLAWETIENECYDFKEDAKEKRQRKEEINNRTKKLVDRYVGIAKTFIGQAIKEVTKMSKKIFFCKVKNDK